MRYWLPVLLAAALVGIALGRAHPAGQICQETSAIRKAAGILPSEPLHKLGTKRLEALLKDGAPACAIEQLGQPDHAAVKQAHDVPASVSGAGGFRAWLTNLGLDVTGWVLLGVAALLVLRSGLTLIVSRRPGVVDVGTVTDATGKADPAIAAQIQQRLTEQHLFGASLVPGGNLPEAVATTLKDTDLPNAKSLAALVSASTALLPKSGVTISAALRSRPNSPKQGCTVTLTDLSNGRMLDTFTQWRNTPLDAADAAAVHAITHILDRDPVRRRTPNWSRFGQRSRNALEELAKGGDRIAGVDSGTTALLGYEQAVEHYKKALKQDPSNLAIAMKLGGAQEVIAGENAESKEGAKQMFEAAQTYLRARSLWTYAYAPRYRAAIALAACADHTTQLRGDLKKLGLSNAKACRTAAEELLQSLVDDLRWGVVVKRWLETFYIKREREAGTRRYFQRFINPLSVERLQLRATYRMAQPVVRDKAADSEVKKLLCKTFLQSYTPRAKLAVNWQVRYNAVCYYARRAKATADEDERRHLLITANRLLKEVLRDPRHEVTGAWLLRDPDLALLRPWPGAGWFEVNVIGELSS